MGLFLVVPRGKSSIWLAIYLGWMTHQGRRGPEYFPCANMGLWHNCDTLALARRFPLRLQKKHLSVRVFGSPKGNRTPVTAVKGRCLNLLTMGPYFKLNKGSIIEILVDVNSFLKKIKINTPNSLPL